MSFRDGVYRSGIPLICVCDNQNNEGQVCQNCDHLSMETRGTQDRSKVLRPLSGVRGQEQSSSAPDWSGSGDNLTHLTSDWPACIYRRRSAFYKSGSSQSSSSSTPIQRRSERKTVSDDNLLSPATLSRRHSLLRASGPPSSHSPSSILTTSSSPRLSSHTNNSPQSKTLSSVEDSPLSKLSQETIETPMETERSNLEPDKLFLSAARPHPRPLPPDMTQSLYTRGPRLQSLHNTHYATPPPEMTQSLHAQDQVGRENNMQNMPNLPGAGENMQYDMTRLGQSAEDQLSHLQMMQRFSMQPSYQFIEDYENISPRLIHNANLMHHLNSLHRTSLLEPSVSTSSMTPEFNEFVQNSQILQSSLQKSLIQTQARQSPPVIKKIESENCESNSQQHQKESNISLKLNPLQKVTSALSDKEFAANQNHPGPTNSKQSTASLSSYQIVKTNSQPSALKGILVKNKNSRSMSSLAVTSGDSAAGLGMSSSISQPGTGNGFSSRLNRASLHLPLTTCAVSPMFPDPETDPQTLENTEINKITETRMPSGAVSDSTKMLMSDTHSFTGSFTWSDIGVQTEVHYENKVSCATTAKLLLGVVISAFTLVFIIFVMKCKFKIGFQMNMCYYL